VTTSSTTLQYALFPRDITVFCTVLQRLLLCTHSPLRGATLSYTTLPALHPTALAVIHVDLGRWRHWKAFYADINQTVMEKMMDEMAKPYDVDGTPTSLRDLGYLYGTKWQVRTTAYPLCRHLRVASVLSGAP